MAATPDLSIANEALAECPQDPIQTPGESSLGGREITRAYNSVLTEMLGLADWEFARKRMILASVPNDRPMFWPYAYALPDDLITPTKLVPSYAGYDGLYIDQYFLDGRIITYPNWPLIYSGQYEIAEEVFYSFEPIGILEYVSSDVTRFTTLFRRAFVLRLASRIVLPITKSVQRQQSLLALAEVAEQRAMADNMNRQPRMYAGTMISTAQQARQGDW